ncbi:MAG: hypothetical protein IGS03_00080 [Candidatus Sericytochromatia bacterium]|nr:hypothetical protein [Candidatus Sericytochromatia bacterium]
MAYALTLELAWEDLSDLQVQLLPVENRRPQAPLEASRIPNRLRFEQLQPGNYLLNLRYQYAGKTFDAFYFELDLPDITQIHLRLSDAGAQIDQMGFLNDYGEFVDMLIYADEKPWLTRPLEQYPLWAELAHFLAFHFADQSPADTRQKLDALLGDLSGSFGQLGQLWAHQLKPLLQPMLLVQTSTHWKACLLHWLRNHLILMDHERLYENLQEAMALAQQEQEVDRLLRYLEWDPDTGSWLNEAAFLAEISGQRMLLA